MRIIYTNRTSVLAICSMLAIADATPVLAQETADIIVTARRVEERLQDVPISITVYNQEQVAKRNITNLNDLAIYTPSLGASNVLGNAQATFSLRGFNQESSTAATVAVFFADVVAPRGASNQQAVGDGAGPGAMFDLQNVQILKGPQGTLFGRNTTGGAILLVPQKPTGNFEGYIEGNYGEYDMWRLQGVVNIPLSENARLRLGVDRQKRDGYVKNNSPIGPRAFNDINYTSVRASLVVDLAPDIESYTIGTYAHSRTNGEVNGLFNVAVAPDLTVPIGGGATITIPGAVQTPFAYLAQKELERYPNRDFYSFENNLPNPRTELTQWQISNSTTWKASDTLTIKNIASYAQLTYDLVNPVVGVAFDISDYNPFGQAGINTFIVPRLPAGSPVPTFVPFAPGTILPFTNSNPQVIGGHTADQWTATEELQFQGNMLDNKLIWQAGFYYERSEPLGKSGSFSPNLLICPQYTANVLANGATCANPFFGFGGSNYNEGYKTIQTTGLYGQASYDLTSQFKVTGGFRYTWDKIDATGALRSYRPAYNPYSPQAVVFTTSSAYTCINPDASLANGCTQRIVQKASAPTWLIGLDFKPTDDLLLYAKYVRGYRTGGVSLQLPTELQTYEPEKVDTYEVGAKTSFTGAIRGTFNISGFYNNFQNQQIAIGVVPKQTGAVANAQGVVNAGKSRIYGAEIEAALNLFKGFTVSAGYSYLNTKITQITLPVISNPASPYKINPDASPRVGDELTNTAKNKVSATAAYTLPLDESVGEVTFGVTFTHSDKQLSTYALRGADGTLNDLNYLKPRDLLDLNLTWKSVLGSNFDASAFVNNVTKQKYYTYILDVSSGFQMGQIGIPRMYGFRLRYSFGD